VIVILKKIAYNFKNNLGRFELHNIIYLVK